MVLEVPFPSAAPRLWDGVSSVLTAENLQKYECEGVSIRKLGTLASRPKKGALKVAVELMLMNRPGHDKLVVVAMQVFSGDVAIGGPAFMRGIDVEEGRTALRQGTLFLPESELRQHPDAKLRLTLTVRDH